MSFLKFYLFKLDTKKNYAGRLTVVQNPEMLAKSRKIEFIFGDFQVTSSINS